MDTNGGPWREGGIDLQISHTGKVTVSIIRGSLAIPVIETFHGGITAHTVWPAGISKAIEKAEALAVQST